MNEDIYLNPGKRNPLTFRQLRDVNKRRCEAGEFGHSLHGWHFTAWSNAFGGEIGELTEAIANVLLLLSKISKVQNTLKKQNRNFNNEAKVIEELAKEFADCVIYLDLLAAWFDIDLSEAVTVKFNLVSRKLGCNQFQINPIVEYNKENDFIYMEALHPEQILNDGVFTVLLDQRVGEIGYLGNRASLIKGVWYHSDGTGWVGKMDYDTEVCSMRVIKHWPNAILERIKE